MRQKYNTKESKKQHDKIPAAQKLNTAVRPGGGGKKSTKMIVLHDRRTKQKKALIKDEKELS